MLRTLLDYPAHVCNWAVGEDGNPSLGEIADAAADRAVAGGLTNRALTAGDERLAMTEIDSALDQAGNRGLILTGNCSIPVQSSQAVIDAVHRRTAA